MKKFTLKAAMLGATAMVAAPASADQVIADDLIVQGSACIGIDCTNGESFGFDTIRLKENNLRIKAQDTSASASFPTVDWQITFNDSGNGGANKFSIDDIDNNRPPFTIEAGSINNALYVSDAGDIGVGTASPIVEVHAVDGNSPTFRLEQDGSSGFTPQTWDLAGNETNFFIRDVTNGSRLPFRIQPNTPDQAMFMRTTSMTINETGADYDLRVESDTLTAGLFMDGGTGDIGIGTATPGNELHISRPDGNIGILLDSGTTNQAMRMSLSDGTGPGGADEYRIVFVGTGGGPAIRLDENGNLTVKGGIVTTGGGGACTAVDPCDAVFDPEVYTVPTIEAHGAEMWANQRLPAMDPVGPDHPLDMSKSMVRMLNELEHAHIFIQQLNDRVKELETQLNKG